MFIVGLKSKQMDRRKLSTIVKLDVVKVNTLHLEESRFTKGMFDYLTRNRN